MRPARARLGSRLKLHGKYDDTTDSNDDGDPDENIYFAGQVVGEYTIRVFPDPGAGNKETYTLLTVSEDDTTILAQDAAVPSQGSYDEYAFSGGGVAVCDCIPGDADGDGKHLILDVTHLINYLYKNGPAPVPYETCSGDADSDCSVLILDVTYLINYLYKNGPEPGSCESWTGTCGPLEK